MTTAESATRMDTSSPDYTGTETKKPSLLKKVKAKAKKLKSKLKPGQHEPENPDTPHVDHENTSDAVSSGEEEEEEAPELGYTPLSEAVNMDDDKRTAHAEQKDFAGSDKQPDQSGAKPREGQAFPEEDPSAPLSPFKSSGPAGVEQAVPTSYNYFNQDPAAAYQPQGSAAPGTGDSEGREREETPSAHGEETISDSRPFGSDISGAGDKPSGDLFSTGESGSLQDDTSNTAAADRSPEEDRDAKIPAGILAPGSTDTESREGRGDDDTFSSGRNYEQDAGMTTPGSKVTENLAGAKDAVLEKVGYGSTDDQNPTDDSKPAVDSSSKDVYSPEAQKPLHQRAYEGLTGAAVGMGQKVGAYRDYDHAPEGESTTSSSEPTIAQKAYDSIVGTKDSAAQKLSAESGSQQATGEPTVAQKAYDTIVGTKDSAAQKLSAESGSQQATGEPTATQKAYDTIVGAKDAAANKLGVQTGTASDGSSTVSADQKPLTQKVTEAGVGLKETVASKLGYEGSTTNTPGEEMVRNTRETVTDKARQADVGLSADSTPVSQKAADTAYRAKDSTVSTLTPNEDDKALSQNVTETISNLPTLLTEKLGLGGASTTTKGSSETEVPVSSSPGADAGTPTSTPAATSPGIVNRVTEAMSSLFGGGKKTSAGTGEEYSPTGSGHRDATDATSMVTDTPRSSPAA